MLPTNWKLAIEGFMEGYHVMRTHPQLYATPVGEPGRSGFDAGSTVARSWKDSREFVNNTLHHMELLSEGMGGMIHARDLEVAHDVMKTLELPEDNKEALGLFFRTVNAEITSRMRAQGIDMPDLNDLMMNKPAPAVQFMFPHYFLLPQFAPR